MLLILPLTLPAQPLLRHDIQVVLQPEAQRLQVTDTITLPAGVEAPWHFLLHADLQPVSPTPGVRLTRQPVLPQTASTLVPLAYYVITLPPETRTFVVQYAGTLSSPIHQQGAESARRWRDPPGSIAAEGVFLSGMTYWYPRSGEALLTFALEVQLPQGWDAVSQGQRTQHERRQEATLVRWEAPEPQEQIYLVGGKFAEYSQTAGPVQAMIFLRTLEAQLAQRYLEATAQYVAMYNALLGPYPYKKFALVENFWDSGYGMPSFTLLGPQIIRFPFILHSAYPHEILHSWWGNGVFVDEAGGNWSEGLTAYLADHLVQEQHGAAADYRRTVLQKYADYVAAHQDFPLTAFRARHDAVTEAVGYGKALMFFHMLRRQVGDKAFVRALREFYGAHRFQRARFDDLRRAFTNAAGTDMQAVFDQWLARPGAPELRVSEATVHPQGTAYLLTAIVEQVQPGPAYSLRLPMAVSLEGQEQAYQTTVAMPDARLDLALHLPARPLRLDVDPQFDVFRRLHRQEIPPALTQMFGAANSLMLLPAAATAEVRQGYHQLAQAWQQTLSGQLEVRWDNEVTALPADRVVWLCGWDNRWRSHLATAVAEYDAHLDASGVQLVGTVLRRVAHAVVLTARHPLHPQLTLAWIATDNAAALPGLGRKLPHYGKYSYLGFTGDEPVNVAKGQWPVVRSPMSVRLPQADGHIHQGPQAALAPQRALAILPEAFSTTPGAPRGIASTGWATPEAGRPVSLGTVPDFAYEGQGYRISDVAPDSPAAQVDLQAGDVIVQLGTTSIPDLHAFASALHTLQPGERIAITFRRGGVEHTVQTQVGLR